MIRLSFPWGLSKKHVLMFLAGCGLLGTATMLMLAHVDAFRAMRDALPLAAQISSLASRRTVLQEQVELTQLNAAMKTGSAEEKFREYILPEEHDLDRILGFLGVLHDVLRKEGKLSIVPAFDLGERLKAGKGLSEELSSLPVSFTATVTREGMKTIAAAVDLAGDLTVGDAFSGQEYAALFAKIEAENPAGIIALEQFLSADLFAYADDQRMYDERLKRSFSAEGSLNMMGDIAGSASLAGSVKLLQGPVGKALHAADLWPLPSLVLERLSWKEGRGGFYEATFHVLAYAR